jgi:ubiquinone/menaquinone biosynthesis C-methylase UbiE
VTADKPAPPLYGEYYKKHGRARNDLLANPEVLFQTLAADRANISALQKLDLNRDDARVLDVGCGTGASLLQFMRLGFDASNLVGIDTSDERIAEASELLPGVAFRKESADALPFADGEFDLVFESTMLGTLESATLLENIAREMLRVTKPGGYVMLADWRYSREGSGVKTAISAGWIAKLFSVGTATRVVARERGALVPPLGRRLSRITPSLYFLTQRLFPFAVGQMTTVLQKL